MTASFIVELQLTDREGSAEYAGPLAIRKATATPRLLLAPGV